MKIVRSVNLDVDSVALVYMDDANDVRAEGGIYQSHTIVISRGADHLEDEITTLEDAVNDLLQGAIQTWAGSLPFDVFENARQQSQDFIDMDDDDDDD